eukprot:8960375-Prorocentrum_lima.AAC.1
MTSSLVGSGDVYKRQALRAVHMSPKSRRNCPTKGGGMRLHVVPGDRKEPVSYTHLTLPTICSV